MSNDKANLAANLEANLRQFTGSEEFYRSTFRDVIFSEGVKYLADEAQAYWLVEAVAAHLTVTRSLREHGLLFWKLAKRPAETAAVLTAVLDTGLKPIITQVIPYTDFPLDSVEIWASFDGQSWTLYLPSEH